MINGLSSLLVAAGSSARFGPTMSRLLPLARRFHASAIRRAGGGHEPLYEPGGYLFNEKVGFSGTPNGHG